MFSNFLLYFPYSSYPSVFSSIGKKVTHVHWNENTEERKNSLFPLINLENFEVILVIILGSEKYGTEQQI